MRISENRFTLRTIFGQTTYWKTNNRYYRKGERGRTMRVCKQEYERERARAGERNG